MTLAGVKLCVKRTGNTKNSNWNGMTHLNRKYALENLLRT